MNHVVGIALGALFLYMCGAYVVSLLRKDNGTADIAYGWGFVLVAWITYTFGMHSLLGALVSMAATVWAARLSVRIYLRSRGKPEDFRYKKWRDEWGSTFLIRSFFQVYMLQGAIIFLIALPLTLTNLYGADPIFGGALWILAAVGVGAWLVGFYFEALGDYQLAMFLRNPAHTGRVMDTGLWRYTRHPNYFGESLMWWGIALIACGSNLAAADLLPALLGFIGPALITFLLLKVSGVPMLEAHFAGNPEWEAYKKRTSVFIPLPPRTR